MRPEDEDEDEDRDEDEAIPSVSKGLLHLSAIDEPSS